MKLELFIMGRNKIQLRIENIGDIFNSDGVVLFNQIDINGLVSGLYTLVNGADTTAAAEIIEMSLSGN